MNKITNYEKNVIRELAKQVEEIAALPVQKETIRLWKALNAKKPERPMVTIDQLPWHELDVNGELKLQCENGFAKKVETDLRKTLYAWRHMPVDMVVDKCIDIPKVITGVDFGIKIQENRAVTDENNDVVGHSYIDQFVEEGDIEKIKFPNVQLDRKATDEAEEMAHELLDGILKVRMQGMLPNFPAWDDIAEFRSVENILYDTVDRPEFLHSIISRYTEVNLARLDQLEEKGLLGYGQKLIHCTGAFSNEISGTDTNATSAKAKDLWTFGMSQLFATVSPAMHEEFELEYYTKWFERFGLVYYGCCEPLHNKISMIRKYPNVRKISISPWANLEKAAEEIGKDYVLSRKPSPTFLTTDIWNPEISYKDIDDTMKACKKNNCPVEFILKDISTVKYKPRKLWEWADHVMKMVKL